MITDTCIPLLAEAILAHAQVRFNTACSFLKVDEALMTYGQFAATSQFILYGKKHFTKTGYDNHKKAYATGGPDALNDQSNVELLSTWIAAGLYDKVHILRNHYGTCERLAELATQAFIENDLFTAVHKILGKAHGSFGISACCSVDRELVVIASRGQAMSISFNEQHGVVLWGSEACALAVPFLNTHTRVGKSGKPGRSGNSSGFWPDVEMSLASTASGDNLEATGVQGSCTHRHDLDEDGGEVVELRVAESAECFAKNMMRWASSHNCHSGVFGCRVDAMGGFFAPFLMQVHACVCKSKGRCMIAPMREEHNFAHGHFLHVFSAPRTSLSMYREHCIFGSTSRRSKCFSPRVTSNGRIHVP